MYIAIQTSTIRPNVRSTCSTNRCEILGLRFLSVLKVKTRKSFFTFFALTRKDLNPTILPQFSFFSSSLSSSFEKLFAQNRWMGFNSKYYGLAQNEPTIMDNSTSQSNTIIKEQWMREKKFNGFEIPLKFWNFNLKIFFRCRV